MEREIKFRAWCPHNEEMYTDENSPEYTFRVNQGTISFIPNDGFDDLNSFYTGIEDDIENGFLNIIAMQFINRKDKNGDDIYEGDIIVSKTIETPKFPIEEYKHLVEWRGFGFHFKSLMKGLKGIFSCTMLHVPENVEIIGNIYQNPELLK